MATCENIHLIDIEKELNDLWDKNPNEKKIKACLFNLVVYIPREARVEYFKGIITRIIHNFPCRVILIERESDPKRSCLEVSVATEAHFAEDVEIGCDRINLKVSENLIDRVPYIVTPHLVPDLPVYLLWGKDPTVENDLLPHFQQFASRIIFDTECTGDLQKFCQMMLHELETLNTEIMDMHWALISPWRDVMGQVFNNRERIEQLSRANSIGIVFNSANDEFIQHRETQAIYFQGWLAAQLGWKLESISKDTSRTVLAYIKGDKKINIELSVGQNANLLCGSILSMHIETEDLMIFDLIRYDTVKKVVIHVTTGDQCLLPFTLPMPNLKSSFNFMREIFYEKTSDQYRNMLKKLAENNWQPIYEK